MGPSPEWRLGGTQPRSLLQRARARLDTFLEQGPGDRLGELGPVAPPTATLHSDERLPCSQLWAHPSSPGASGLQAPLQQQEPGQGDRGLLIGEPRRKGWVGGELRGLPSILTHTAQGTPLHTPISFPGLPSTPLALAWSDSGGVLKAGWAREGLVTQETPVVPGWLHRGEC